MAADVVVFGDLDSPTLGDGAVALAEGASWCSAAWRRRAAPGALSRVLELAPVSRGRSRQRLARALASVVFQVLLPKATPRGRSRRSSWWTPPRACAPPSATARCTHRTGFEDDVGVHTLQRSVDALVEAGKVAREAGR
jgi:Tfp pilus assembly pilus retraction ATPase PilT